MHDAVSCQAQPLEHHGHGQRDANLQRKLGQITSGQVSGKKRRVRVIVFSRPFAEILQAGAVPWREQQMLAQQLSER